MSHSDLQGIVVLMLVSVLSVFLFRRFNLSPILAYLFVGIIVGPNALGWIPDSESTRFLAEFGVVFLMFTVGLEFSLPHLVAMRKEVFGLGAMQVMFTLLIFGAGMLLIGESLSAAFIIGGVIALSSTAIVIKQLTEQLEMNSRHGRLAVAMLIFQDLAVIPFLIIIPALGIGASGNLSSELMMAMLKAVVVIAVLLAAGHWLLRPIFHAIAKQHSSELFTLTILLFSVAAAWITDMAGLSLALGAFIAGMMLAESEFRHQVEVDIRPFRDVLLGLFFITVGMLLDLSYLPSVLHWVVLLVIAIISIKFLVIMFIGKLGGIEKGITSRTALTLAQGGEFGFAILAIAFANGVLSESLSQVVLAAVIISMALSPIIIRHNSYFAKRWFADSYMLSREKNTQAIEQETRDITDHVVICGYGRIGQNVAQFLKKEGFAYTALDLDPITIKEAHDAGEHVFYGDSTHLELLRAVNIEKARVLLISYDDYAASIKIIQVAKILRPDLPILVRTRDDSHLEELQNIGATEIVPETVEASLMLSSHLLMLMGVPMKRVVRTMQEVRASRYQLLHEFYHGQDTITVSDEDNLRVGLHSLTIPEGATCIGKKIEALNLDEYHVKISTLRHDGVSHQQPASDSVIQANDVLVLYATPENAKRAQEILLQR